MSLIPHKGERVGLVIVAAELKSVACHSQSQAGRAFRGPVFEM